MKINNIDLYETCDQIVESIPNYYSNDQKLRKLYWEVGKLLAKSPTFFYEKDLAKQKEIYENYQVIHNREVICRNVVYLYFNLCQKLGLNCRMIEMDDIENMHFNHWALVYENEGKKYLINPIPDFYRVQLGFSTRSFCHAENYFAYAKETFDSMSDDYLRKLDESIGYLNAGGYYTDELFEKFSNELNNRLGRHIVRTSDAYQDYYLTLLDLICNKEMTLQEKMNSIRKIDVDFDQHKNVIQKVFESETIHEDMKKIMHSIAYKKLIGVPFPFATVREGSDFIRQMDVSNLENKKKEILLYKFEYMMCCIPKLTVPLTGYIENKNFIEELCEYIFPTTEERECIHRHTIVQENEGKNEYYLMFSLKDLNGVDSFYCFYDHQNKTFQMPIEPIAFMLHHHMKPLKNSTLHDKMATQFDANILCLQDSFPYYQESKINHIL